MSKTRWVGTIVVFGIFFYDVLQAEIQEAILQYAEDDTGPVLQGCATAIGRMAEFVSDDADQVSSLRASLEKIAANQSSEVRKMAAKILKEF